MEIQKSRHPLWLVSLLILFLGAMILFLRWQGRLWIAASGKMHIWIGDAYSPDNSQHLLDPYSFSHFLHGVIFFFLLARLFPRFSFQSRWAGSLILEGCWEMLENSRLIIDRYREVTAALGYSGDTIYNSIGDLISCGFGFWVASKIGWKRSLMLFLIIETACLFWIKDNLTLNVLMLIYPIESIKDWQLGL